MSSAFDVHAETYGRDVQSSIDFSGLPHDFFLRAKALLLADMLSSDPDPGSLKRCLDVGCGIGALHPHLAPAFETIVGVDVSRASIAVAATSNASNSYLAYDGDRLPFDDASFDVALTVCVLHHVVPQDWSRFLSEMRRVVRPGGLVFVIEHNPYNPLTRLAVRRCAFDKEAVLLRPRTLLRLFQDVGLVEARTRQFLFLPSLSPIARRCEGLLQRLPLGAQYLGCGRR